MTGEEHSHMTLQYGRGRTRRPKCLVSLQLRIHVRRYDSYVADAQKLSALSL